MPPGDRRVRVDSGERLDVHADPGHVEVEVWPDGRGPRRRGTGTIMLSCDAATARELARRLERAAALADPYHVEVRRRP
jgi:hypothetical protein